MDEDNRFISGNDAVAIGAKLARPHVISAYPITPQTVVVERLSEMVEEYCCNDAEVVLITLGSITGTARAVTDRMRNEGRRVGLLKIRYMRPFPVDELIRVCENIRRVGVVDRDISFGYEGTVFTNVNSALYRMSNPPETMNFICGMGGRDVSKEHIEEMFLLLLKDSGLKQPERVRFIGMRVSINEQ